MQWVMDIFPRIESEYVGKKLKLLYNISVVMFQKNETKQKTIKRLKRTCAAQERNCETKVLFFLFPVSLY